MWEHKATMNHLATKSRICKPRQSESKGNTTKRPWISWGNLNLNLIGISMNPIHTHTHTVRERKRGSSMWWKSLHSLNKTQKRITFNSIEIDALLLIRKKAWSQTTFKTTKQKQKNTSQSIVCNKRIHEPIPPPDKRYKSQGKTRTKNRTQKNKRKEKKKFTSKRVKQWPYIVVT
jgi:hypothetical protein